MAIYSLCTTPASRSNGRSAIAMAAYRAGERLLDRMSDKISDYTRKTGIVFKEIFCPNNLKIQRQDLWNLAEEAEKRKDARIAREILIALPYELTENERIDLAKNFAKELVDKYQIAVDLCIHLPSKEGDKRNHHAHLLLTTRTVRENGLGDKSDLERSNKYLLEHGKQTGKEQIFEIRNLWENFCNLALERKGLEERISAKSYKDRHVDLEPTIHVGSIATAMERKGIQTDRGDINREIEKANLFHKLQNKLKITMDAVSKISKKIFSLEQDINLERTASQPQQSPREIEPHQCQPERYSPAAPVMERMPERQQQPPKAMDLLNKSQQGLTQPGQQKLSASGLLKRHKETQLTPEKRQNAKDLLNRRTPENEAGIKRDRDGIER